MADGIPFNTALQPSFLISNISSGKDSRSTNYNNTVIKEWFHW